MLSYLAATSEASLAPSLCAVSVMLSLTDLLNKFSVSVNQIKDEFIDVLCTHELRNLRSLRQDLFTILISDGLLPDDFKGLPLVSRRDSPTRSIYKVLSTDCWTIVDCIVNKTSIPRTLLKNGKRGKDIVSSQSRRHPTGDLSTVSQPLPQQSQHLSPSSVPEENSHLPHLPDSISFSNLLIAREIATFRTDLDNTKADLREGLLRINSSTSRVDPLALQIASIKEEVSLLHQKLDMMTLPTQSQYDSPVPSQVLPSDSSQNTSLLTITTFNCRGLSSALPYILHLIENGSDVIALPEHWLWPFNIGALSKIHPDYEGFGSCDERLTESCTLNKGCGGIGIIWRKSLHAVPLPQLASNRHCAIQLHLNNSTCLTVMAVYLPSSNYSQEEYHSHFHDFQSTVATLETSGPVILLGDFNVDTSKPVSARNYRNDLFDDFISAMTYA